DPGILAAGVGRTRTDAADLVHRCRSTGGRMKFRIVLVAATMSLCGAPLASAELRSIGVQSGWSTPLGDLADGVRDGTYVGVSANQPIGRQQVLFLDVNYHALRDKTTVLLPGYLAVRLGVRITETV